MTYTTAKLRNLRGIMLSLRHSGALGVLGNDVRACVVLGHGISQRHSWELLINDDAYGITDVDAAPNDGNADASAYLSAVGFGNEPSRSWSPSRTRRRKQGKIQT